MKNETKSGIKLLAIPILLAFSVGCTYVSQADYEDKLDTIDQDGDGAAFGGPGKDCDDNDAARAPGNDEIPYDGIDNDCDGNDLVDVDGDTHPGIANADWIPQHDGLEWPVSVKTTTVDCDDTSNNTFPGKGTDPPYDGIDADCDCSNDFDVDGDGDVPPEHQAAFGTFATESCFAGATPTFTDCDDFDADANGNNTADGCGDGLDADCSGDNDYDCDDDGYMPDTVSTAAFNQFVNAYHGGTAPASWGPSDYGDCDDDDASVFPGASDTIGDGIDSDCGCNDAWDNDYDGDGDGWIPNGNAAALAAYAASWCSGQTQPIDGGEGDCDDNNASVNPGQLETLGDGLDSDCSSDNDTSPLTYGDLNWTSPRPPALTKTNGHYILVVSADSFADPPAAAFAEAGVALVFGTNAGPGDTPAASPILFQGAGTVYPIGPSVDVAAVDDEFRTAYTYSRDGLTYALTARFVFNVGSQTYTRDATDVSAVSPYENVDIDIELDSDDNPWVWSVGTDRLHVLHGDSTNGPDTGQSIALTSASTVFIDDPSLGISTGTACDATGCETFTYDGNNIVTAATQPWSADNAVDAHQINGVVALADGGTGLVVDDGVQSNVLLGTFPVHQARSALASDGTLYALALVDNLGDMEVKLVYGDPVAATFSIVDVPIDAGLTPTGIGLHVDDSRVFIGVSSEDGVGNDAVGWLFLAPA